MIENHTLLYYDPFIDHWRLHLQREMNVELVDGEINYSLTFIFVDMKSPPTVLVFPTLADALVVGLNECPLPLLYQPKRGSSLFVIENETDMIEAKLIVE